MSKKIHKKRYPYGRFMWKCRKFNSKSIEEWIDRPVNITIYLDHMVKYGKVTQQEGENLKQMILSPDKDDRRMALIVMKSKIKK